jgi:hypothetical protein
MQQTFVFDQKPVIGKHTLANYSKEVARALGLSSYTGYWSCSWRRTTVTLAADSGHRDEFSANQANYWSQI